MRCLYLILVMTGLFLAAGCQEKGGEGQKHSVVVTQPEAIGGGARSQFSGTVKEAAEISLGFKTVGQIERICVKEGQYVRSGQLLAVLDQKDYALGVKASEAQYRQLKDEVDRLRKLYETQGISGNDYEKALAGLEQVEVNLQVNRNKLDYTRLYAPASGYINKVNFERAEMVNAGTPVFSLISQGQMEVEVSLPLWTYLHRGDIREATALLNGQQYRLQLRGISPKADGNQLYKATFTIAEANYKLAPKGSGITNPRQQNALQLSSGMNADVVLSFSGEGSASGFALPMNAVFEADGKSCVWVVEKDKVTRREVVVSTADAQGRAIISSGLQGTETIVRAGVHALQDGEQVVVLDERSKTNVGDLM